MHEDFDLRFCPLFKPNIFFYTIIELLGLNFEFEKKYSQTLMLDTKIVNVIDSNILMHMCQNGWMNKKIWEGHVKLQIGNE